MLSSNPKSIVCENDVFTKYCFYDKENFFRFFSKNESHIFSCLIRNHGRFPRKDKCTVKGKRLSVEKIDHRVIIIIDPNNCRKQSRLNKRKIWNESSYMRL